MAPRLLLGLTLACVAFSANAFQPAMLSANGGGGAGCPLDADTEATSATEAVRPGDKRAATGPARPRAAAPRRSGDSEAAARAPRWHSFLPGMIR